MGYWAAGHGWLYILLADILPCCGERHKNLFHLPAARIEVSWEQGKCSVCWTLGFDASPGVQRAVSVFTRDFWRCFLSRKVQFLIESNCSIWLTAVFHPKTFSAKIYCLEEALLTLFCIYQSMMISHSDSPWCVRSIFFPANFTKHIYFEWHICGASEGQDTPAWLINGLFLHPDINPFSSSFSCLLSARCLQDENHQNRKLCRLSRFLN